mmetsp:Transcript_128718/g.321155  ORF Transcript_128718/g.321155 Transcript_128718/m.321155 type:complete len:82 (+) Transcript_128718:1188-1433(+)
MSLSEPVIALGSAEVVLVLVVAPRRQRGSMVAGVWSSITIVILRTQSMLKLGLESSDHPPDSWHGGLRMRSNASRDVWGAF